LVVAARAADGKCFRCGERAAEGTASVGMGDEVVYAAACKALGSLGAWAEAAALVEVNMPRRGVAPSARTLALAMRACGKSGGSTEAADAALRLLHATSLPEESTVPAPSSRTAGPPSLKPKPRPSSLAYSGVIRALGRAGRCGDAVAVLEAMEASHQTQPAREPKPTGETYACALTACAIAARAAGRVNAPCKSWGDAALAVLGRMEDPNTKHFTAVLGALASEGRKEDGLRLFLTMQAVHGIVPDALVFGQLNLDEASVEGCGATEMREIADLCRRFEGHLSMSQRAMISRWAPPR
jgi:pentatricopeptide repeat protein